MRPQVIEAKLPIWGWGRAPGGRDVIGGGASAGTGDLGWPGTGMQEVRQPALLQQPGHAAAATWSATVAGESLVDQGKADSKVLAIAAVAARQLRASHEDCSFTPQPTQIDPLPTSYS
jgi:hypothetical protein